MFLRRQFFRRALVDHRPDQRRQIQVTLVGALQRRAQPQPPGRARFGDDDAIAVRGQMVRLVKDQQAKALQLSSWHRGGIVGDDGDRANSALTAADNAHRAIFQP